MLFNSFQYLIFLPIVFLIYWFIFKKNNSKNFFILLASYFFYGCWSVKFLSLIMLTTLLCFFAGMIIGKSENRKVRRWVCGLNIVINLLILGFFKYSHFFIYNLKILLEQFGFQLDWFTFEVLLPVGISFYTFQAISYPIDVYRGKIPFTNDFIAFSTYITFFPQLVAGPIERSTQLLPQFLKDRHFDYSQAVQGMRQMLWGFFKKIVIADNCAYFVNEIFDKYEQYNAPILWLGAFFFAFQVYGDFSGYSDIAIGSAKLFGINLTRNFHFPYFSRSIAEFWRRWNISLTNWFTDYVYIPLGGGRCGKWKKVRNVMIIFLLSGTWHGAEWTYVIWGAYFGLLMVPLVLLNKTRMFQGEISPGRFFPSLKELGAMAYTFMLVLIPGMIFRSATISDAGRYMWNSITVFGHPLSSDNFFSRNHIIMVYTLIFIGILMLIDWTQRNKEYGLQIVEGRSIAVRWSFYLCIIFSIIIFAGTQKEFVYFQF